MTMFKHERAECRCIDAEANQRIFWLASWEPGCLQACLSAEDAAGAAPQFKRYGVLGEGEIPLDPNDDRISEVIFEWDLVALVEKMLDGGFTDPEKEIAAWLLAFQHCSKRLGEELLKIQGEEGPPPRF